MANRVPPDEIEAIVGHDRDYFHHYARAISETETVYILHSQICLNTDRDLLDCRFTKALDRGIDLDRWGEVLDQPTVVLIESGKLVPAEVLEAEGWL